MKRVLVRALPFVALGAVGLFGLLVATVQQSPSIEPAPLQAFVTPVSPAAPASQRAPDFTLMAEFDHDLIPADAESAYLRVALTGAERRAAERMPAELTLVIDRSGSMSGAKIRDAKRAAKRALESLRVGDRFRVIAFGSNVQELGAGVITSGVDATSGVYAAIDRLAAAGGTDMVSALRAVRASRDIERVARVILLSDGQPDTEVGLKDRVGELATSGTITTTIGVGLDYNEDLMEQLADLGRGNYYFVERATNLATVFDKELGDVASVVARDVVVQIDGDATPLGLPKLAGRGTRVAVGDLYAGRTVELLFSVPLKRGANPSVGVWAGSGGAKKASASVVARAERSTKPTLVAASVNGAVMVQAARWETSQAWLNSNGLYNAGDRSEANRQIDVQLKSLRSQAQQYGSVDLQREVQELEQYRADNNTAGNSRRSLNNYAKWKARGMNR